MKKNILGVGITDTARDSILKFIDVSLEKTSEKLVIVTPNPEMIVYANKHEDFKRILNSANIALPDGVGVSLAGKVLAKPFKERITGVDFMLHLCEHINKKPITVGFLGGRNGVADLTAECLQRKYPGLKVGFVGEEWPEQGERGKGKEVRIKNRNSSELYPSPFTLYPKTDILFVAFGFPKQEEWMFENIDKLEVRVMMGVGGAFDYISGQIPRAPKFIRALGFEWLFRLIRQPWRWKRQLALIEFLWLVFREKINF